MSHAAPEQYTTTNTPEKPRKKRRIFMWFFLVVQAIFIIWIIGGLSTANDATNCGSLSEQACRDAGNVGTGIGVLLIVGLWMVVDFFLAITYLVVKMARR